MDWRHTKVGKARLLTSNAFPSRVGHTEPQGHRCLPPKEWRTAHPARENQQMQRAKICKVPCCSLSTEFRVLSPLSLVTRARRSRTVGQGQRSTICKRLALPFDGLPCAAAQHVPLCVRYPGPACCRAGHHQQRSSRSVVSCVTATSTRLPARFERHAIQHMNIGGYIGFRRIGSAALQRGSILAVALRDSSGKRGSSGQVRERSPVWHLIGLAMRSAHIGIYLKIIKIWASDRLHISWH